MLAYFCSGGYLPWDTIIQPEEPFIDDKDHNAFRKRMAYESDMARYYKAVSKLKRESNSQSMIPDAPVELQKFVDYCINLEYADTPDYDGLISQFQGLFKEEGYEEDGYWDWVQYKKAIIDQRKEMEAEQKRR